MSMDLAGTEDAGTQAAVARRMGDARAQGWQRPAAGRRMGRPGVAAVDGGGAPTDPASSGEREVDGGLD